jgi:hypothetical protein
VRHACGSVLQQRASCRTCDDITGGYSRTREKCGESEEMELTKHQTPDDAQGRWLHRADYMGFSIGGDSLRNMIPSHLARGS